jgi:hypothetical protein
MKLEPEPEPFFIIRNRNPNFSKFEPETEPLKIVTVPQLDLFANVDAHL